MRSSTPHQRVGVLAVLPRCAVGPVTPPLAGRHRPLNLPARSAAARRPGWPTDRARLSVRYAAPRTPQSLLRTADPEEWRSRNDDGDTRARSSASFPHHGRWRRRAPAWCRPRLHRILESCRSTRSGRWRYPRKPVRAVRLGAAAFARGRRFCCRVDPVSRLYCWAGGCFHPCVRGALGVVRCPFWARSSAVVPRLSVDLPHRRLLPTRPGLLA